MSKKNRFAKDEFTKQGLKGKTNTTRYKQSHFTNETLHLNKITEGEVKKWEKRFIAEHARGKKGQASILGIQKVKDRFQHIYNNVATRSISSSEAFEAVRHLYTMSDSTIRRMGSQMNYSNDLVERALFFARAGAYNDNHNIEMMLQRLSVDWLNISPKLQGEFYNELLSYADKDEKEMEKILENMIDLLDKELGYDKL